MSGSASKSPSRSRSRSSSPNRSSRSAAPVQGSDGDHGNSKAVHVHVPVQRPSRLVKAENQERLQKWKHLSNSGDRGVVVRAVRDFFSSGEFVQHRKLMSKFDLQ